MYFTLVGKKGKSEKEIKIQRAKKIWEKKPTFTYLVLPPLIFGGKERKMAGMPKNLLKIIDQKELESGVNGISQKEKGKNLLYRKWLLEEKEAEYHQAKEKIHLLHQNLQVRKVRRNDPNDVKPNVREEAEGRVEKKMEKGGGVEKGRVEKKGEQRGEQKGGGGVRVRKIRPLGSPTYQRED